MATEKSTAPLLSSSMTGGRNLSPMVLPKWGSPMTPIRVWTSPGAAAAGTCGHAELGAAGGQDAGTAGDPNRCVGVAPDAKDGGPCGLAGPEGERKFFLERHGEARYHGCRA